MWEHSGQVASLGSKIGCETPLDWDRRTEGFREHIAVDGSAREREGRRAVVRNQCHDAGRVGSVEHDQASRAMGLHHGVPPPSTLTVWTVEGEEGCIGSEQQDANLWFQFLELLRRKIGIWTCEAREGTAN